MMCTSFISSNRLRLSSRGDQAGVIQGLGFNKTLAKMKDKLSNK